MLSNAHIPCCDHTDYLPAVAAVCCTTTLRGALPTGIVAVRPVARSTTVTSFEPSLVTYTVLPSPDVAAQFGCFPTATLRAGLFVSGSNKSSSPGPWTTTMPNAEPRG